MAHNKWIGVKKTLKNTGIMFGVPALLYFLGQAEVWVPKEYLVWAMPIAGAASYYLKNWLENK